MDLRGKLDLLEGHLLDAQVAAHDAGVRDLVGDLEETLALVRRIVGGEVTGRPLGDCTLGGMEPGEDPLGVAPHPGALRRARSCTRASATARRSPSSTSPAAWRARPSARSSERSPTGPTSSSRSNRMSSWLYVLTCKLAGGRYASGRRPVGPVRGWKPPSPEKTGGRS